MSSDVLFGFFDAVTRSTWNMVVFGVGAVLVNFFGWGMLICIRQQNRGSKKEQGGTKHD